MEKKCENQAMPSMRKISNGTKKSPNGRTSRVERPEVTLRETKGCFRRGTEKLPLQALAKWRVVHGANFAINSISLFYPLFQNISSLFP